MFNALRPQHSFPFYSLFCVLIILLAQISCTPSQASLPTPVARIDVDPSMDIAALVERAQPGTAFYFAPGLYRGFAVVPKDKQQFIGAAGVTLSGAIVLKNWQKQGQYWVADDLPPPLDIGTNKRWGSALAQAREDLFLDGVLQKRVAKKSELKAGHWFYEDGKAYLSRDPGDALAELSAEPFAFAGSAAYVVLKDLEVVRYASAAHAGAIHAAKGWGWKALDLDVQWNHGVGLTAGPQFEIKGGRYNNNGQLGIRVRGIGGIVENTEMAYNNYAGYDEKWEAGGIKFSASELLIRNNDVHHNFGKGIWGDVDCAQNLIAENLIYFNHGSGISYEICTDGVIRDNFLIRNGLGSDEVWLWYAGIQIFNSSQVTVTDNTIVIDPRIGNGIAIIHKDRGKRRISKNIRIENNILVHLGHNGKSGAVADAQHEVLRNSGYLFDRNTYILPSREHMAWQFVEATDSFGRLTFDPTEFDMEENGALIYSTSPLTHLSKEQQQIIRRVTASN